MIIKSRLEGYVAGVRLYPFKDAPAAPPAPDPNVVSQAQTASNLQTANANAQLNRVNQYTPYGNLTYSKTPGASTFDQAGYDKAVADFQAKQQGTPITGEDGQTTYQQTASGGTAPDRNQYMTPGVDQWSAKIELSPEQQALLSQDNRIKSQLGSAAEQGIGRVTNAMGQPFDVSQMAAYRDVPQGGGAQRADLGGGAQNYAPGESSYTRGLAGGAIQTALPNSNYADQRTRVEDAIYSRVNPQLQRDRNALDVKLANQGIMPGSEAYNTAIDESNRQANDARYQAVLAGGQEQSRLAGLDLQAGQFANSAQAQGFNQQATNATLNNNVNDTLFNQGIATTNQNNQAQQQNFAQQLAGTAQNNQANQQDFAQQIAASQMTAAQRQQQMQEQAYLRSLPLNELNALRTGAQVNNPQFSAVPQSNVSPTNVADNIYKSLGIQQQNASNQTAANNSFQNGLFSLGSAFLM